MRGWAVLLVQGRSAVWGKESGWIMTNNKRNCFRIGLTILPTEKLSLYLTLRSCYSPAFSKALVLVKLARLCVLFRPWFAIFTATHFSILILWRSPPAFLLRSEHPTQGAHKTVSLPWYAITILPASLQASQGQGQLLSVLIIVPSMPSTQCIFVAAVYSWHLISISLRKQKLVIIFFTQA